MDGKIVCFLDGSQGRERFGVLFDADHAMRAQCIDDTVGREHVTLSLQDAYRAVCDFNSNTRHPSVQLADLLAAGADAVDAGAAADGAGGKAAADGASAGAGTALAASGEAASHAQGLALELWQEQLAALQLSHKHADDVTLCKEEKSYPIEQTVEAFARKNSPATLR
jgi:hypothetical protein